MGKVKAGVKVAGYTAKKDMGKVGKAAVKVADAIYVVRAFQILGGMAAGK